VTPAPGGRTSTVDVLAVFAALRRRAPLLLVAVALGGSLGLGNALLATPMYTSTATVLFSLDRGQSVNELVQGANYAQTLVQTYTEVATAPVVLGPVVSDLDLGTSPQLLARSIDVKAPLNTTLMDIEVTRTSAPESARIANAVAAELARAVASLAPEDTEAGITVRTIAPAVTPVNTSSPNKPLSLATGLAVGGALGIALVLLLEVVLATTTDRAAVGRATSSPVLALVPRSRAASEDRDPAVVEAHRTLRTNLSFLHRRGSSHVVVLTSAASGDGKTTTAIALARSSASTGQRVLLVDADLRRPVLADRLGLLASAGLSTVLTGRVTLDDVLQPGPGGIDVLASGVCPPNPSELLASTEMRELLELARSRYDCVVLDCAPVLPVTDAAVLARQTDGAVVVVDARRTQVRALAEVDLRLRSAGAAVAGVIINRTARTRSSYYGQRRSAWWSGRRTGLGRGGRPGTGLRSGAPVAPVASNASDA